MSSPILNDKIVYLTKPHKKCEGNYVDLDKDGLPHIMTWKNAFIDQDPLDRIDVAFSNDSPHLAALGMMWLRAPGLYQVTASFQKGGDPGQSGYGAINVWTCPGNRGHSVSGKKEFTGFDVVSSVGATLPNDAACQTTVVINVLPAQVPMKLLVTASHQAQTNNVYVKGHKLGPGGTGPTAGSPATYVDIVHLGC